MELAWVIPALSAAAFFVVAFLGRFLPKNGSFVSIAAILIGFVLFWFVLADLLGSGLDHKAFDVNWITIGETNITWGVHVDRLSVVMLGLVTFVALLVQVYSLEYMRGDSRFGWYFAVHSLFAAAMLALVLADNLIFLYVAWELVGLGSYLLIGFWWERKSAAEAAKKAFVTTRIGDVGLLIGIILLFRATGTFDISTIIEMAKAGQISQGTITVSALLIFMGAMGKSAQFPFHVWLPDAMEGPTPVSALIHAATMVVAGVYLTARMLPMFELVPAVMMTVSVVGLFTFIFAGTMALVMTDIKRILAYSTISHLGLMMLSLGAFGLAAAIFHLVAHGVSKAMLFLGAGSIMHGMGGETDVWKMGGFRLNMRVTTLTFVIGAASLASQGRRPLTPILEGALVRLAASESSGVLEGVRTHPSTIRSLANTFRQLRHASGKALELLDTQSELQRDVVQADGRFREAARPYYDREDLAKSAADAIQGGTASGLTDLGAVILFQLRDITPGEREMVEALASAWECRAIFALSGDEDADSSVRALADRLSKPLSEASKSNTPASKQSTRALMPTAVTSLYTSRFATT